jgi:hypothetical protein
LDLGPFLVVKSDVHLELSLPLKGESSKGEELHTPRKLRWIETLENPSKVIIFRHHILLDIGAAKKRSEFGHIQFHYFLPLFFALIQDPRDCKKAV